tara:strand:- start:290 stop:532 length:243 start_codon:yes stop_codon:yes gene_type:complete
MGSTRRIIGKITSPFFVPLRRFIAWGDEKFGTCDHQLVLQPRPCYVDFSSNQTNDVSQISELQKKVSKDKANIEGLGESN